MIYIFKGKQRQYKTTAMIAAALWYHVRGGYALSEIYSNIRLFHPDGTELKDYHYLTIAEMRLFVRDMVGKGYRHIIIIIDEIDRVFPHRWWNKLGQSEALIGLWQDEKLFLVVLGTMHIGKGMDLLLRESMQIEAFTRLDKRTHTVKIVGIDTVNRRLFKSSMVDIDLVQKLFDSWKAVT
jgi:hypothetical protein